MVNKNLYILPNQLFETKHFPSDIKRIIVWEHPEFFKKVLFQQEEAHTPPSLYEVLLRQT